MKKDYLRNLVIASHNVGKIHEFKSLLSPYNIKIKSSSDLAISEVDEIGKTFEENAIIKVKSVPKNLFALNSIGTLSTILRPKPSKDIIFLGLFVNKRIFLTLQSSKICAPIPYSLKSALKPNL